MEAETNVQIRGGIMKKRYAVISVILLVAFMWSCQTEKSSPFAPEDMTTVAANDGNGTATVTAKKVKDTATYMIEVFFGGSLVGTSAPVSFGNPNCLRDDNMLLDVTVLNSLGCFDPGLTVEEVGIFQIFGDSIGFWFDANGCTRKNYIMWMPIVSVEGTWPPANVDEF
ncbi:MAG: hypothetical protein ABIK13_02300, partial [Patescibacteria group bacterium]